MKAIYTLLILFIPFFGFGQIPNYVPQDGLVGWWPFNGNAIDETGNGNNGTVNDAVLTSDRFGNYENAYNYNGANTFITLPNDFFNGAENGNYTINLWTKHNSTEVPVFTKGGSWKKSYIYITSLDKVEYGFRNGTNTDINILESNISLDLDFWYNICITHTDDEIKLYINGILDSQLQTSDVVDWSTSTNTPCAAIGMHLGKDYNDCTIDNGFYGVIDDFGIWNRALSNEEVLQLYNSEDCIDTSNSNISACENYEWNGQTYTESGTYEYSEQIDNEFSMSFDGVDDYLSNTNLNPSTNSFSIMIDVIFNDVDNGSSLYEMIAQKWSSSNDGTNGFHLRLDRDLDYNGATFPYLRASVSSGNIGAVNISTDFEISSNTFYNLCMVINRITNKLEFYVDSELIGSENISQFTDLNNPHPLEIGRHYWTNDDTYSHYFNGAMDNFSYWDYPLNSEQINQYMTCPPTGNEEGLVGCWNFEEGEGETVIDLTGNGNDGTINGASYSSDVPEQSCQLTTINGCDSVAVLNLTITQPDTSFTEVTACESYEWNGEVYTESGIYDYSEQNDNEFSMSFDGVDDYVQTTCSGISGSSERTISFTAQGLGAVLSYGETIDLPGCSDALFIYLNPNNTIEFNIDCYTYQFSLNSHPSLSGLHAYSIVLPNNSSNSLSDLLVYQDGIELNVSSGNDGYINTIIDNPINIGRGYRETGNNYFSGEIDNVNLWDKALSQNDIQQYMNCLPTGNEEGLVGYWGFEEGDGNTAYDLSGNENDGIINGATYSTNIPEQSCQLTSVNGCDSVAVLNLTINQPDTSFTEITACESYEWNGETYTESGTYEYSEQNDNEYSMSFDGDNEYVNCGNGIDISNKSFTLSAWVKKDGADFTGASIVMTTGNGTINNGLYFGFNYQDGQDYLFLNFYGNGICYSTLPVNIEGDGEWYHIAATYNLLTNERILYLNGIIVGSDISQSAFMSSNTDFCIGITSWNLVDDFNGKIDDACVWDRVLTQSEIQNYVNCPPTGNEEGLVGYWNFEEGQGDTVYDLSENGNDGTINGATYDNNVPSLSCNLTNVNGCDSVAVLNLTINYTTYGIDTQVHCDTYTWIDGNTYTESNNTATFTLTNSNNCDSIVTLDLIINNSDNTSSSVTSCDEFTWDGQTYTESGVYTNTYTNANGCDSIHTLNLIINNSISSNTEASSCSSYEWNGLIYENSGTYEFDTIATNGCDSTAVLELEICYLDQLEINGPTAAVTSTTSSFSVQDNAGSAFIWSIEGLGTISSGQFTNEIFIDWSEIEGVTNICVYEKYDCSGLECLGDTVCLEVELKRPTGVVEYNLEVNIYPNPSLNIFNIEFNSDSEIEILVTNVLGEQVYFESTNSIGEFNTQIDLSNYSKGIYNLTLKTSDGLSNHKLILQ